MIAIEGLVKKFGKRAVLDHLALSIGRNEDRGDRLQWGRQDDPVPLPARPLYLRWHDRQRRPAAQTAERSTAAAYRLRAAIAAALAHAGEGATAFCREGGWCRSPTHGRDCRQARHR